MRLFKPVVAALLLTTVPPFLVYPEAPIAFSPKTPSIQKDLISEVMTYDDFLDLFDGIESGELTEEDVPNLPLILAYLAREGLAPGEDLTELYQDIEALLGEDPYSLGISLEALPTLIPSLLSQAPKASLCKWSRKRKRIKKFFKKHKKALIVGAVVVVGTATIVTIVLTTGGAAAAPLAAAAGEAIQSASKSKSSQDIAEDTDTLKETLVEALQESPNQDTLPQAETARIVGSTLAHTRDQETSSSAHQAIDALFSTKAAQYFLNREDPPPLPALSHTLQGEAALKLKKPSLATHHFTEALSVTPDNIDLYLHRSFAHLQSGQRDAAMQDFNTYAAHSPLTCAKEFAVGFAKGLPKGVGQSGTQTLTFAYDFACHPFQTAAHVGAAFRSLAILAKQREWETIGAALGPEIHKLITEWDSLPLEERGELAGFAIGKHGTDFLTPGAVAKGIQAGTKISKEVLVACQNLKRAERVLALEGAAAARVPSFARDLKKVTPKEIRALKKGDPFQGAAKEGFLSDPKMCKSYEFFNKVEKNLKPYTKKFMPESKARQLIHAQGVKTFPRPRGIPENYKVKISKNGAGMKYVHPNNSHTYVRVMPGKLHSKYPHQQKPYVKYKINGKSIDKFGNHVLDKSPEAHISLNEFIYIE